MANEPEGEHQGYIHDDEELYREADYSDTPDGEEEEGGPVKSFLEHLEDLRWTLIKSGVSLGIGMVLCLVASPQLVQALTWPIQGLIDDGTLQLEFLGPTAGFMVALRLAFYGGLVLACPFILFFVAQFVVPALRRHEKKYFIGAFSIGGGLFVIGVFICYFAFLNLSVRAFFQYNEWLNVNPKDSSVVVGTDNGVGNDSSPNGSNHNSSNSEVNPGSDGGSNGNSNEQATNPGGDGAKGAGAEESPKSGSNPERSGSGGDRSSLVTTGSSQIWRAEEYFLFVARFMLAMGLSFELPVVILTLVKLGLVDHENLVKGRKYMLIFNLVLASVVTPQDLVTTVLMVLPLQFLFEICIWISSYWHYREKRREAALGLG